MSEQDEKAHEVCVPPTDGQWVSVVSWPGGASTHVAHTNAGPITLAFSDPEDPGSLVEDFGPAPEGWRTRCLPPFDTGAAQITRLHQPGLQPPEQPDPSALLGMHPLSPPVATDSALAASVQERETLDSVRQGWIRITGVDEHGRAVYSITDAGKRRAAALLGISVEQLDDAVSGEIRPV